MGEPRFEVVLRFPNLEALEAAFRAGGWVKMTVTPLPDYPGDLVDNVTAQVRAFVAQVQTPQVESITRLPDETPPPSERSEVPDA